MKIETEKEFLIRLEDKINEKIIANSFLVDEFKVLLSMLYERHRLLNELKIKEK